ncbi:hypothetical protein MF672_043025 [Actinomadura sp. ATCC 31491]|uniref:Uncharacterized protein n=1 Tax=Actinomadura luzonensis TaxID=2805427 RepID=A0ABT0G8E4_9ACTN|nr:hypothetical protein [Actinomadura luzonensis]
MLPYLSCSSSASTTSPPPPATYASIASSSAADRTGLPWPVVRSQRSPDGCAITRTSCPASTSGWSVPEVRAVTVCPRWRSRAAARA